MKNENKKKSIKLRLKAQMSQEHCDNMQLMSPYAACSRQHLIMSLCISASLYIFPVAQVGRGKSTTFGQGHFRIPIKRLDVQMSETTLKVEI